MAKCCACAWYSASLALASFCRVTSCCRVSSMTCAAMPQSYVGPSVKRWLSRTCQLVEGNTGPYEQHAVFYDNGESS